MRNNKGQPKHDDSQKMNHKKRSKEAKDVREANKNVRKAQGEENGRTYGGKTGNRPAFDRDR
jgi:hypothetical protein